jgi:hypothetical protein
MKIAHDVMHLHYSSTRKILIAAICLGIPLLLFLTMDSSAQEQRRPTNLKILDSTIAHDSLIAIMSRFSTALGVECEYCHTANANGRGLDFASDDKKTKLTTRVMLKMVSNINGTYLNQLPTVDTPQVVVECVTCHRGQPAPRLLPDVLRQVRRSHGMAAMDSVYRNLRKEYYGSATFDFSDQVLARFALEVSRDNSSDALAILNLNKEFNPQSATNEWAMGRVHLQLGDTATAIADYKRALEINPDNRRVQRELQELETKK